MDRSPVESLAVALHPSRLRRRYCTGRRIACVSWELQSTRLPLQKSSIHAWGTKRSTLIKRIFLDSKCHPDRGLVSTGDEDFVQHRSLPQATSVFLPGRFRVRL